MLSAIRKGKFKIEPKMIEDSLTSAVFDYLILLPDTLFWNILRKSNVQNINLPVSIGKVEFVDFWPKWDTKKIDDVSNSNFIEPDLVIEFEKAHLIIEAKRYDNNQQCLNQWKDQITAFNFHYNKDDESIRPLIYFALGGIWDESPSVIAIEGYNQKIFKLKWQQILDTITNYLKDAEELQSVLENKTTVVKILNKVLEALAIHGYYETNFLWLNTMSTGKNSILTSLKHINKWKKN